MTDQKLTEFQRGMLAAAALLRKSAQDYRPYSEEQDLYLSAARQIEYAARSSKEIVS